MNVDGSGSTTLTGERRVQRWLRLALCASGTLAAVLLGGISAVAGTAAPPPPQADLAVSTRDSRDPVLIGADLTYRVVVANLGPDRAKRVKLSIAVAGAAEVIDRPVTSAGSCSLQTRARVVCVLGAIGRNRKATVVIAVDPFELGTISLATTVVSATADRRRRNNRAAQTTRVLGLHSVQGRGVRSTMGDAGYPTVTTEIDARSDPTAGGSAAGTFSLQYAAISASPARGSDLRGRVVCLSVEGNKAMAGGIVESSNNAALPAGTAVRLAFTDNGDPGAGRDTSASFLGGQPTCALEAVQELPLIDGNFVVRDGEP